MVQMRTTWAAKDSVDGDGGLTDSAGALPPSPLGPLLCLGSEGAPWCWAGITPFVGAGGSLWGPERYHQL